MPRNRDKATPVGASLKGEGLGGLAEQAERLRKWEAWLMDALPDAAREHIRLARLDAREVVLVTDSPAWSSRVRYLGPQLQDRIENRTGTRPARVSVRVASLPRREAPAPPRILSPAAGETLERAARSASDPRLARALTRLARHARKAT